MNIKLTLRRSSVPAFLLLFIILSQILIACAGNAMFAPTTPTALPTPTNDPLSAAKVVQAFWDALNAGDLETAMLYVGEKMTCAGFCHFSGKIVVQSYLQAYVDASFSTKIGDLKSVGNIVTYSWELYQEGLFQRRGEEDEMMEVENGKIIYWENYQMR